jgi:hypothetical protein
VVLKADVSGRFQYFPLSTSSISLHSAELKTDANLNFRDEMSSASTVYGSFLISRANHTLFVSLSICTCQTAIIGVIRYSLMNLGAQTYQLEVNYMNFRKIEELYLCTPKNVLRNHYGKVRMFSRPY